MRGHAKEVIIEVAKGQLRVAPEVLTSCGSGILGLLLVFGSMSFNDPVVSREIARWAFRLIGVLFIVSSAAVLWRS